jgi:hypothetical protein
MNTYVLGSDAETVAIKFASFSCVNVWPIFPYISYDVGELLDAVQDKRTVPLFEFAGTVKLGCVGTGDATARTRAGLVSHVIVLVLKLEYIPDFTALMLMVKVVVPGFSTFKPYILFENVIAGIPFTVFLLCITDWFVLCMDISYTEEGSKFVTITLFPVDVGADPTGGSFVINSNVGIDGTDMLEAIGLFTENDVSVKK